MGPDMIHTDERQTGRPGQCLRGPQTDEQRSDQPRFMTDGNGIQFIQLHARIG